MSSLATYFIIRYNPNGGLAAYATGCNIFAIPEFHNCRIVRWYPSPPVHLTHRIVMFQRLWRLWLQRCRWYAHPHQIRYRQIHGRFPPLPLHLHLRYLLHRRI